MWDLFSSLKIKYKHHIDGFYLCVVAIMKKLLLFLLPFLLLAWCWDKDAKIVEEKEDNSALTYQKQKDCIDYRNEYSEYLDKKFNLWAKDYITISDFFYSEIYDKCVVAYEVIQYDNYDTEWHDYNISDVFEDKSLYHDSDFLTSITSNDYDENLKIIRDHNDHTNKRLSQVNKYRTWKTWDEEREEME